MDQYRVLPYLRDLRDPGNPRVYDEALKISNARIRAEPDLHHAQETATNQDTINAGSRRNAAQIRASAYRVHQRMVSDQLRRVQDYMSQGMDMLKSAKW